MEQTSGRCEVVIVGGGIAGAALAFALAAAGRSVTVLERTNEYVDRVRGEAMQVWGVREAQLLGVEDILLGAGGRLTPEWRQYRAVRPEPAVVPMAALLPDVAGTLAVRHPVACQALLDAASEAGAVVVRGVEEVGLGANPVGVSYRSASGTGTIHAALIVGADGRNSAVRRASRIRLEREAPTTWISGMLVDQLHGVPDGFDVTCTGEHPFLVLNHQGERCTRAYLMFGERDLSRYAGPSGPSRFLEDCGSTGYPWAEALAGGRPAGPCATYPGDDTWTATPFAGPVVLVGDAAGHNDPIMGQGLGIAMRDVRIVRDLVLERPPGAPVDFAPYGLERDARMRRLRMACNLVAAAVAEDADNRLDRLEFIASDFESAAPRCRPIVMGGFIGPEHVPEEALDPTLVAAIRAA